MKLKKRHRKVGIDEKIQVCNLKKKSNGKTSYQLQNGILRLRNLEITLQNIF